ncbi:MAG: cupin domain-containing protein [Acetobacteraceae bacterium]|nr:cupin domain-containing protein [Rhodovarius sp.]MDW8397836.1 cupin domain-containing protein [Acetobacteraceae bacterium]
MLPAATEAGRRVSAQEAERRVLLLAHPDFPRPAETRALLVGIRMLPGGEGAPAHRHSQSALRMVLAGEPLEMRRGNLILTPGGAWHAPAKPSGGAMIWLDGPDGPVVNQLGLGLYEHGEDAGPARPEGFSAATFGRSLLPDRPAAAPSVPPAFRAPQLRYPYADALAALAALAAAGPPDPRHGYRIRYANALTGGHVLATIGAFLSLLPEGFAGAPARATDSRVLVVLEGEGESEIGSERIPWREGDILAVPNWTRLALRAARRSVIFAFSDIALQQRLGLWREDDPSREDP